MPRYNPKHPFYTLGALAAALLFSALFVNAGASPPGEDKTDVSAPAADPGLAWSAIYADFLKTQNFELKEYLLHNDRLFFPAHRLEGEFPAVLQAMFYEIPEFAEPVMVLIEFLELKSRPGQLDTFPIEIAYIIKDGAVTRDLTEAQRAAVFGERPQTGMVYVKGEPLRTFVLAKPAGQDTKAALGGLYAWLYSSAN